MKWDERSKYPFTHETNRADNDAKLKILVRKGKGEGEEEPEERDGGFGLYLQVWALADAAHIFLLTAPTISSGAAVD